MTSLLNFMKTYKMIQKLLVEDTQTGRLMIQVSLSFLKGTKFLRLAFWKMQLNTTLQFLAVSENFDTASNKACTGHDLETAESTSRSHNVAHQSGPNVFFPRVKNSSPFEPQGQKTLHDVFSRPVANFPYCSLETSVM
jgi:hypothetical protein